MASGPGTSVGDTFTASNNLVELAGRVCISPASAFSGVGRLFTIHWPAILGTQPMPLALRERAGQAAPMEDGDRDEQ